MASEMPESTYLDLEQHMKQYLACKVTVNPCIAALHALDPAVLVPVGLGNLCFGLDMLNLHDIVLHDINFGVCR